MEKLPRQVYTTEFRQQAVELITRDGLGIAEAARRLSISPKTLTNWIRRARGGDSPAAGYDNAPVESFFGTLKTELVHHRRYRTRAEAEREITEYVDLFYNRQRRQARLGYLSAAAYTQQFMRQRQAA